MVEMLQWILASIIFIVGMWAVWRAVDCWDNFTADRDEKKGMENEKEK